jgi:hypothetical protein
MLPVSALVTARALVWSRWIFRSWRHHFLQGMESWDVPSSKVWRFVQSRRPCHGRDVSGKRMLGQQKTQTVYVESAVTTLKEQTALETACLNVELLILAMRSDALFSRARDKVDPGTRTMKLQNNLVFCLLSCTCILL